MGNSNAVLFEPDDIVCVAIDGMNHKRFRPQHLQTVEIGNRSHSAPGHGNAAAFQKFGKGSGALADEFSFGRRLRKMDGDRKILSGGETSYPLIQAGGYREGRVGRNSDAACG